MTKIILKYISIVLIVFALIIIYLSTVGIETEKFNNQIKNLVKQKNDNFDTSLKKINFIFDITENNFNFRDISFDTNNINFISDRLDVKKDKKDYLFEGSLRNKKSLLNDQILQVIKLKYTQFDLINTKFESENDFTPASSPLCSLIKFDLKFF